VPIGTSKFPDLIGFYRYENNHGHLHTATHFRNVGGMVTNCCVSFNSWGIDTVGRVLLTFAGLVAAFF